MVQADKLLEDLFKLQAAIWSSSGGENETAVLVDDLQQQVAELAAFVQVQVAGEKTDIRVLNRSVRQLKLAAIALRPIGETRARIRHYVAELLGNRCTRSDFIAQVSALLTSRNGFPSTSKEQRIEAILQKHSL